MTDAEPKAWVTKSREAQDLPPVIEDPSILAKIVPLLGDQETQWASG